MTQPKPDNDAGDEELLSRLNQTSAKDVGEASRAVNRFTEDDDAHDRRWVNAEKRRTFIKIQRAFFWFLFGAVCVVITVCAAGYLYLVWKWVSTFLSGTPVHDVNALRAFINNVLWALLVIFATLFLEGVFRDRER